MKRRSTNTSDLQPSHERRNYADGSALELAMCMMIFVVVFSVLARAQFSRLYDAPAPLHGEVAAEAVIYEGPNDTTMQVPASEDALKRQANEHAPKAARGEHGS